MGVKETVEHRADTLRAIADELERAEFVGMFAGSASQKWMSAQLREIAGPPPDRVPDWERLFRELCAAVEECDQKARRAYLLTTGPWHRVLQKARQG